MVIIPSDENSVFLGVFLALVDGILPKYLMILFWKASGRNPFVFHWRLKGYVRAFYDLASLCSLECFDLTVPGHRIFKIGLPETENGLREKVDAGLVNLADNHSNAQRMRLGFSVVESQRQFQKAFAAAQLLGLIPNDATYDYYYNRGTNQSMAAETKNILTQEYRRS